MIADPEKSYVGFFNNTVPVRVTERGKSINSAGVPIDYNTVFNFFDFQYDVQPELRHFQVSPTIHKETIVKTFFALSYPTRNKLES